MTVLTDRQRIELALPACLLFAVSDMRGAFVPADPKAAEKAAADIAAMRLDLRAASLEPFVDLPIKKRQAALRRLERVVKGVVLEWKGRSMLGVVLTQWYFLKDLTDREVLLLWEGSAMDRAMRKFLPMFEHGFDDQSRAKDASEQALRLLARLQNEGFYR